MNKKNIILTVLAVLLAAALVVTGFAYMKYRETHVKVDGEIYEVDLQELNIRGTNASMEHYQNLRRALPNCRILWDIPFQGSRLPDDIQEISVEALTREDVDQLSLFKDLQYVDARECRDYEAIQYLQEQYPELRLDYQVELGSQTFDRHAQEASFTPGQVTGQQLMENLTYLPDMQSIYFEEPDVPAAELYALQEAYPEISITWTKSLYGQTPAPDVTEIDISDTTPASLEEVEALAAYFPNLEKLIMCNVPFENDDMAAFRDKMRPEYKVVWLVHIGKMDVRTDETSFMPGKGNKPVRNGECYNMRYLEDLIVVDIGHQGIQDIDWVVGTPHLKYLILTDGGPSNIEPLGCLKELVFLELMNTYVKDLTPLVGCTALEDLNVGKAPIEIDGLLEMPWLKNLWAIRCGLTQEEREALNEALPNTHIQYLGNDPIQYGWRKLPNYYKMRDALDMWYMDQ